MGKRKLVWIDADDDGRAIATARVSGFVSPTDEEASSVLTKRLRSALDALPSALLIGAEEREELALAIYGCDALGHDWRWDDAGDYARRKREKYLAVCDAIVAAGYRKVTALDREKLVEAIADELEISSTGEPRRYDRARALLARVEVDRQ